METEKKIVYCEECGRQRQYFVTGAVCPNGCGKLYQMSRGDFTWYRKKVERDKNLMGLLPAIKVAEKPAKYKVQDRICVRAKEDDFSVEAKIETKKGWRRIKLKEENGSPAELTS